MHVYHLYIYADIDECSMDNGGCFHICDNFIGSYQCLCHPGYEPLEDQKNCTGMPVQCQEMIMHVASFPVKYGKYSRKCYWWSLHGNDYVEVYSTNSIAMPALLCLVTLQEFRIPQHYKIIRKPCMLIRGFSLTTT